MLFAKRPSLTCTALGYGGSDVYVTFKIRDEVWLPAYVSTRVECTITWDHKTRVKAESQFEHHLRMIYWYIKTYL